MSANSRVATAVQILCVLAYVEPGATTSEAVARSLDTNPVVVRRMLKDLAREKLVEVRPGRDGGVRLARSADEITLADVHRAVGDDLFALRGGGNARCPVNRTLPGLLGPIFAAADTAVVHTLAHSTIGGLARQVPPRAAS
jgi:Rrf2 family protein